MSFERIAAVVAAYVVMAVLLLSLNIFSRWRWWVKAGATIVSGLFFVGCFLAIASLLGRPSPAQVPDRFSLIATRVVEPNRSLGDSGAIYLWLEELDADNIPSGIPLSYRIGYADELARTVEDAQTLLENGESVEVSVAQVDDVSSEESVGADPLVDGVVTPPSGQGSGGNASDYVPGLSLIFNNMPPVRLPEKGAL